MTFEEELSREGLSSLDELKSFWGEWTDGAYWVAGVSGNSGLVISRCDRKPSEVGGAWEIEDGKVAVNVRGQEHAFHTLCGIVNRSRLMPALIERVQHLESAYMKCAKIGADDMDRAFTAESRCTALEALALALELARAARSGECSLTEAIRDNKTWARDCDTDAVVAIRDALSSPLLAELRAKEAGR